MSSSSFPKNSIPTLEAPVTVRVDSWGISHIEAASSRDVFRAQGWVHAADRLFQMDLWLRRGLGRLAEVFGEGFAQRDRAARLFLYRKDADSEQMAYGEHGVDALRCFAEGVNAFISAAAEDTRLLPPEFHKVGYQPLQWNAEDISRIRSHGLFDNVIQEVDRAETIRAFGETVENLRRVREPSLPLVIPEGLDLSAIRPEILQDYLLATSPVVIDGVPAMASARSEGSNNWVISGSKTATGRPILANDPHRSLPLPSLRYLVHLKCPDFDVIGAGEPVLPGISIGHNGKVAFGLTIFPSDQEDLYVYDLNPDDAGQYRWQGGWAAFDVVQETIEIRDREPIKVELLFSTHGPVLHVDKEANRAFALRAAWLEPGAAPYLGSLRYLTANSVEEFLTAVDSWAAPSVNHVVADDRGNIAWAPRGLIPRRPNWDGALPVPGDGRYEWDGFLDPNELPSAMNPQAGWLASANQFNLPDDWSLSPVTTEWLAPFRYQRIAEELEGADQWGIQENAALQNDVLSLPALSIVGVLRKHQPENLTEPAQAAVNSMLAWDCRMDHDSEAAARFELWFRERLRPLLLQWALEGVAEPEKAAAHIEKTRREDITGDARVDLMILDRLEREPIDLRAILARSLEAAAKHWPDVGESWGDIHTARFIHPICSEAPWSLSPLPKSGGPDTVNVSARDRNRVQTVGASLRFICDVGEWDNSVVINTPGQSGDPRSEHYSDLASPWASGQYFQLAYSPEAVAGVAQAQYVLEPEASMKNRNLV